MMVGFFVFMMTVVLAVLLLVGGFQWLGLRRRIDAPRRQPPSPSQLDRIESALLALEGRVDDLQEQQRFLERLLADRPEPPRLAGGRDPEGPGSTSPDDTGSILFDTGPGETEEER